MFHNLRARLTLSQVNLAIFKANQTNFLGFFLTRDKCWVHHFDPESKRQSMQWKHPGKGRLVSREGDGISFLGCKGHCVRKLPSERQNY